MQRIYYILSILIFISNLAYSQKSASNSQQLLLKAISANDTLQIKDLVSKGANVNGRDKNGATMLMWAAYKCDLSMVKFLVSKGANCRVKGLIYPDTLGSWYGNLLGIAAAQGKLDMLKYFIEQCKIPVDDPEFKEGKEGWTALQWASFKGNLDLVVYLLLKKANPNSKDVNQSPILLALRNYHSSVAQMLIMFGANWQIVEKDGWTPLHYITRDNDVQTFLSISKQLTPQLLNLQTNKGLTPLHLATINDNDFMVAELCRKGADKDIKDSRRLQAIDYSIKRHRYPVYLFLKGTDYGKFTVNMSRDSLEMVIGEIQSRLKPDSVYGISINKRELVRSVLFEVAPEDEKMQDELMKVENKNSSAYYSYLYKILVEAADESSDSQSKEKNNQ